MDENYDIKLFIVGFNNFVLEDSIKVKGELKFIDDFAYFFNIDQYEDPGEYIYLIRFFKKGENNEEELLKEEYFKVCVKFENINIPVLEKVTAFEIFGENSGANSDVILYYLDEQNHQCEMMRTKSDPAGKFAMNLNKINFKITKDTQKLYIKSIDIYGNESAPLEIN